MGALHSATKNLALNNLQHDHERKDNQPMNTPITSTIGTLRPATPEEILKAAQQTEALQDWQKIFDFAKQLYGEQVYQAELEIDRNFDDGEEHRYLVMIHAHDKEKNKLPFDFSLPFWHQEDYSGETFIKEIERSLPREIERIKEYRRKPGELSQEELDLAQQRAVRQVIGDYRPELSELDRWHNEFYIDRPPLSKGEKLITLYIQA
jgi:hypothetical protein